MVGVTLSADADDPQNECRLPTLVECADSDDNQFNIESQLSDEQRQKLLQTLHNFPDVFFRNTRKNNISRACYTVT